MSQALVTKFEGFDEELMDYLQANAGEEWNCGSTATVSLMYKDKIVVANGALPTVVGGVGFCYLAYVPRKICEHASLDDMRLCTHITHNSMYVRVMNPYGNLVVRVL